ncbi:MAG: chorismate synthase, partial [Anaerolineae bacterium]
MRIRFLTAGESHGPQLTAVLEGMPAGLALDLDEINGQMARRQKGYGSGGRMKIEKDAVQITAGFMAGQTTGGPIAITIPNKDFAKWQNRDIPPMTIPRPGHADLTGAVKYGYRDLRLALERASARETAVRVAVGAICQQLLAQFGVTLGSYVTSIGPISADIPTGMSYPDRFAAAEASDVRCPIPESAQAMRQHIRAIMESKDTAGGVFEVAALGVPPGLGSHVHWDRRLDAQLMWSVGSIHATRNPRRPERSRRRRT